MLNEIKHSKYSIVIFGRKDCAPCHTLLKALNGKINGGFVYIDVDNYPDLVAEYSIMSVPTVIVFKQGIPYSTIMGTVSAERLNNIIAELANESDK